MEEYLTQIGIKIGPAIASAAGAIISLVFSREISPGRAILSVFGGFFAAIYLAPMIVEYFHITGSAENGISFLVGTLGMNVIIGLIRLTEKFRENPDELIRKIRGK